MARRRKIQLNSAEDNQLRQHYFQRGIPIEQYMQRTAERTAFSIEWNMMTGREDSWDDVVHYMMTMRKAGKWVTFNGDHKKLSAPPNSTFSTDQWSFIQKWLEEHEQSADDLSVDSDVAHECCMAFAEHFGWAPNTDHLASATVARRKRGDLPKQPRKTKKRPIGFSDIDEIA